MNADESYYYSITVNDLAINTATLLYTKRKCFFFGMGVGAENMVSIDNLSRRGLLRHTTWGDGETSDRVQGGFQ